MTPRHPLGLRCADPLRAVGSRCDAARVTSQRLRIEHPDVRSTSRGPSTLRALAIVCVFSGCNGSHPPRPAARDAQSADPQASRSLIEEATDRARVDPVVERRDSCLSSLPANLPASVRAVGRAFCAEYAQHPSPGASLLIANKDAVLLHLTQGHRCADATDPTTPQTIFRWASVSKIVTALTILVILERRDIPATRTIAPWFPELRGHWTADVTIEQLLSHRAGLPALPEREPWSTPAAIFEWIKTRPPRHAPPQHAYQNVNYVLLGMLVERLERRPWAEAVRAVVLDPLGLDAVWIDLESTPRGASSTRARSCGHPGPDRAPIPLGRDYELQLTRQPWLRPAGAISGDAAQLAVLGQRFLQTPPETALARAATAMLRPVTPAQAEVTETPALKSPPSVATFGGMYAEVTASRAGEIPDAGSVQSVHLRGSTPGFQAALWVFPAPTAAPNTDPASMETDAGHVLVLLDNSGTHYGATIAAARQAWGQAWGQAR